MKNICIFTNTLLKGGAEKQSLLLAKALSEKFNVWLVVYYGDQIADEYYNFVSKNHIRTVCLSGVHLSKIIKFYLFLKKRNIDVVFSFLLTTNLIGGIVTKIAGVKYFYPGIRSSKITKGKKFIQKIIQNYLSTKTIYNNYKGFEYLTNSGFKKSKAIVIPNCFINNNSFIKREIKKNTVILSVGRFVPQKDFFTALKAVKLVKKKCVNIKYVLIGYGFLEKQIFNWINENKASDFVEIILNPSNLDTYYYEADIYLQTSLYEGLSNAVLEAMSFSLPLVVTNVGDNDRLVRNGENGFLCQVGDFQSIAEKLEYLVENPIKRIEFGKKSYQMLMENYSFEKFQKNYIDLIMTK